MTWWGWMVLGTVILGAELFVIDAEFYLVFLGASAIVVGLTSMLGVVMPEWLEWLAFATLSLISMFTFRKSLYRKIHGDLPDVRESVTGELVTIANDLAPGADARTTLRGTEWTIRNVGTEMIPSGARVTVMKIEGLILHVSRDD